MCSEARDISTLKRCSKCGTERPATEFYRDKRKSDGLQVWCKSCANTASAARYHKLPNRDAVVNGTKTCSTCGLEKAVTEFAIHKKNADGRQYTCRGCSRDLRVRNVYNLDKRDIEEMLRNQNGACGICQTKLNTSRYSKMCVDHNHKTGKVRGLLCANCNSGLGLMKESVERIKSAIRYLEKHSGYEDIVSTPTAT